jgi:Protein of unknown function (DUF1524)
VCGLTAKNYNRFFAQLVTKLRNSNDHFSSAAIQQQLLSEKADTQRWPDDGEFRVAWQGIDFYRRLKKSVQRMIFEAIEAVLHTGKTEKVKVERKLTIEHLLPRDWEAHWPLLVHESSAKAQEQALERRTAAIHKVGKVSYSGPGIKGPSTACKLFRSGKFYFAIAGMANDRDRNFFSERIAAKIFWDSTSFESSIDRMELAISNSLKIEMKRIKTEFPGQFEFSQKGGGDVLTILVAAMVGDTPYMAGRGFRYLDGTIPDIETRRLSCPGDCPGNDYVFFGGEQKTARKTADELFKAPPWNAIEFAQKVVESEIAESPETVGPAIMILGVDKNGVFAAHNKIAVRLCWTCPNN